MKTLNLGQFAAAFVATLTLVGIAHAQTYDNSPRSRLFYSDFADDQPAGGACATGGCCKDGVCPIGPVLTPNDSIDRFDPTARQPRNIPTPVEQLDLAANDLAHELRFEMRGSRSYNSLMADAEDITRMSRYLRNADPRRVSPDDLYGGARQMVAPLRRIQQALSADRNTDRSLVAVRDVGNALLTYARSLNVDTTPANVGPRRAPTRSTRPQPAPSRSRALTIPEEMKDIALLPASEHAAALRQRTCPVTGEPLGSMGKPIKVTVAGRSIYVCCQGCVNAVRKNPSRYLASQRPATDIRRNR